MNGSSEHGDGPPPSEADLSDWLLRHRVTVPEPPAGYCERPGLANRYVPTRQRVTVFAAPGGFGKTTLLAAGCRGAQARGVPVAWLTLAAEDDPAALDTYLAFAFRQAGVDVLAGDRSADGALGLRYPRTAMLLRALEASGEICVLALDELERVEHPDAVALLGYLFRNAPACLHVALAYRQLPRGLDAAGLLFDGATEILTAPVLSFSKAEVARFFDLGLSGRELTGIAAESGGWPIALRIWRNGTGQRAPEALRTARDAFDNWIEGRFWDQFRDDDRDLVLDVGLFDWIDADLVETVVETPDAWRRITGLAGLAGLLEPVHRSAPEVYRLHPLLRDHCAAQRRRQTPARYRAILGRLGQALARRGHTVEGMRHAAQAGDPALAGRIFVEAGALQWWLREGADRLIAASALLTDETVASSPRIAMAQCAALAMAGRLAEAKHLFDVASSAADPRDPAFAIEKRLARAMLALSGCEPAGSAYAQAFMADVQRIAESPAVDPIVKGTMLYGLCLYHNGRAEFATAAAFGRRARRTVTGRSAYLTMSVDAQLGQMAMAQGRVREALRRYRSAERTAKVRFLQDPRLVAYVDVLSREIALERNRLPVDTDGVLFEREFYRGGARIQHYAVAAEIAIARALDAGGVNAALSVLDDMWAHARKTGLQTLERLLAALRVSLLADAGRAAEAERTWRDAALPATDTDCLDLDALGWREMEALACARLRLLTATGAHATGRRLADAAARVAVERGLVRTHLRVLALRTRLEQEARAQGDARPHVTEYLRRYARTDYARPMAVAGTAAVAALRRFVRIEPESPLAATAGRLLAVVRMHVGKPGAPRLTDAELDVLRCLPGRQDKEIAKDLGLSRHGVRHHLRGIFRKLGVSRRHDAVRRARALGVLSTDDPSANGPGQADV